MVRAVADGTRLAYVAETVFGTTDATPAFKNLRFNDESLAHAVEKNTSPEISANRGILNYATASKTSGGQVNFTFSDGTLDDILENLMRAAWSTDALINANVQAGLTFEVSHDVGGGTLQYKRFTGCQISSFALAMAANQNITGSFDVFGIGGVVSQTEIVGATYAPETSTDIQSANADFGSLTMAGLTIDCLPSLNLTITNNLRNQFCIGSEFPTGVGAGTFEVTGDFTAYLDENQLPLLQAALDNTDTSLVFTLGQTTGEKTTFEIPTARILTADVPTPGQNNDVLINCTFAGIQDSATLSGGVMRITRNVA